VAHVDIYEDISGQYLPLLADGNSVYRRRPDGLVELVEYSDTGSNGTIVADQRPRLTEEFNRKRHISAQ
jgi:hypothetical protein